LSNSEDANVSTSTRQCNPTDQKQDQGSINARESPSGKTIKSSSTGGELTRSTNSSNDGQNVRATELQSERRASVEKQTRSRRSSSTGEPIHIHNKSKKQVAEIASDQDAEEVLEFAEEFIHFV
jgi:hypothetical protein